jgi:pSer/pThr/pTyr-binding forkhead associated (FHA) protein
MLNLKPSGRFDQRTLTFLEENPSISETLIAELGPNISEVATIIEPILEAPNRCEASRYYIQAVAAGRTAFLTTNLPHVPFTCIPGSTTNWVVGRSHNCAIAILDKSVSRCHAVIGHDPGAGFHIRDLGSSNGTFVNCSRLTPLEQRLLSDGDLLEFSKFRIEFFISGWSAATAVSYDTQY